MKAKRMAVWALALLAAAECCLAFEPAEQTLLRGIEGKLESAFRSARPLDGKAITLLPVRGDEGGFVEEMILEALIKSGQKAVISNDEVNDQRFKRVLKEIRWDEIQTHLASVDPATVDELGHLKSTQILVEGRLDVQRRGGLLQQPREFGAELNLLAYEVKTKQYVWVCRFVLPLPEDGAVHAGEWQSAIRISEIPGPRLVRVGTASTCGHGADLVSDRLETFMRGMLADMGYWVDSRATPDFVLSLHTEQETFDESGEWIVYDGTVKARLHFIGEAPRLLGETDIDARGARGLGEVQASRNLADALEEDLSAWVKDHLRAGLVRLEAVDLQLRSDDSRLAEEIRRVAAAMPGVRTATLEMLADGRPDYVLHAVYDKESFPGGLVHALLVKSAGMEP